jgi:Ca2+-transporting ATPase
MITDLYMAQRAPRPTLAPLADAIHALRIFLRIEGTQRAGAAAHFAFFSLFAAVIVCIAAASLFFERDRASREIIAFVEAFTPIGVKARDFIFGTISGVVEGRDSAGTLAFVLLGWSVMRFVAALVRAVNRAWSTSPEPWWRLSLKSFMFLMVMITAVPIAMALPAIFLPLRHWLLPDTSIPGWIYGIASFTAHFLALFLALSLFYKLAPRRRTKFSEVWTAAVVATLLLICAETLFGLYLRHFSSLNAIYGTFGAVMALLMWIYFSCTIFIYGACLCAARQTGHVPALQKPAL